MMSRELPVHPNLDHLKKQARRLLRELRESSPESRLADAQHEIAQEYGFASWPQLKARVDAFAERPAPEAAAAPASSDGGGGRIGAGEAIDSPQPDFGFRRYSSKARQALFFSRYEAAHLGSRSIDPHHLLLGVIRASPSFGRQILEGAPLSLEETRSELVAPDSIREPLSSEVLIPFGEESKSTMRHVVEEADGLHHDTIGLVHLLLGLLRNDGSAAAALLRSKGVRLQDVRGHAGQLVNEEAGGLSSETGAGLA
jgi:hypothetical protein